MKKQRASCFELVIGTLLTAAAITLLVNSARKLMGDSGADDGGVESFVVIGFFFYTLLLAYLALRVAMKED